MNGGWAIFTGLIGGVICATSGKLLLRLKIDDVVGAIPLHGFAGALCTLAAGIFLQGDMFNLQQIAVQLLGITMAFVWAFSTSYLIYILIDKTIGLRSSSIHEQRGLDFTEHAEIAFPEFQVNVTYRVLSITKCANQND
ncbi:MAG: Amt family ammonium transporter [Cryomorphaceae bacterium]|jgi:Amt family ammonium transporter